MAEEFADARAVALRGLFDDAAVFPPAERSLADAVAAHREHRSSDRSWLVQRLLIRADQAEELLGQLHAEDDLEVGAVLGPRPDGTFAEAVSTAVVDLGVMARDRRVRLTGLEVPLSTDQPDADVVSVVSAVQGARLSEPIQVALEVQVARRSAGQVLDQLGAIVTARAGGDAGPADLIAKVRCGGATAEMIPDDAELAGFLLACAREGVPFKATAGLHHLGRTVDDTHGGQEHGVLNLLAASAAAVRGAGLHRIEELLATPREALKLGPGAMIAGEEVLEENLLTKVRDVFLKGIGCCDVLDPLAELAESQVLTPSGSLA